MTMTDSKPRWRLAIGKPYPILHVSGPRPGVVRRFFHWLLLGWIWEEVR